MNLIDTTLLNKLPKKHQPYITAIYKECGRYSAVIEFEDGFSRSIGEWNFTELKAYIKAIIEENRNTEW